MRKNNLESFKELYKKNREDKKKSYNSKIPYLNKKRKK